MSNVFVPELYTLPKTYTLLRLSELLNLSMPTLPAATQKNDSILVSTTGQNEISEEIYTTGGKWEDEEERRFFEDIQDLPYDYRE